MTQATKAPPVVATKPTTTHNIIEVAIADGRFKTLAAALTAAGLVDTLKGTGPFTVFAPTDDAFAKVPKATLDGLLKDKAKLSPILTYHVVPGAIHAADLTKLADKNGMITAKTVNGQDLAIHITGSMVQLGTDQKAKVIVADVAASNGVIHAIDTVLMPPT
jgi:uncharacterized surface protein with fasciclin (FAS1) repeats